MKNVLVINMGLKSIRGILILENGEKLASVSRTLETILTDEQVTQSPKMWWDYLQRIVKDCLNEAKTSNVDFITVTSSSACLVCIDNQGNEVMDTIMVSDKRAQAESKLLREAITFQSVYNATELDSDPYLMLPKILWVKNNCPEQFARTYKCLSPNDYLIAKLTGRYVTDYLNAQKYHYDVKTSRYPELLLEELGLNIKLLPDVVTPGTSVGCLLPKLVSEWGINANTEVVITSYDAICSFFGSGSSEEGDASDASGTVTSFRVISQKNNLIPSRNVFIQQIKHWNVTLIGGSNNLGGGLIEWIKQCYYQNELYPYELMENEAKEASLGADGLIFLPYLLGERMPIWDAYARGVFFGLERTHTRRDMTRAVFESVGFVLKDMILEIEKTGVEVKNIRFSGGLARIGLISQLKADITGRNVLVLDEFETTALGAAIMVMVSKGIYSSFRSAVDKLVVANTIIIPNKNRNEKYTHIFQLYKKIYNDIKDLFVIRKQTFDNIYYHKEIKIHNL